MHGDRLAESVERNEKEESSTEKEKRESFHVSSDYSPVQRECNFIRGILQNTAEFFRPGGQPHILKPDPVLFEDHSCGWRQLNYREA